MGTFRCQASVLIVLKSNNCLNKSSLKILSVTSVHAETMVIYGYALCEVHGHEGSHVTAFINISVLITVSSCSMLPSIIGDP